MKQTTMKYLKGSVAYALMSSTAAHLNLYLKKPVTGYWKTLSKIGIAGSIAHLVAAAINEAIDDTDIEPIEDEDIDDFEDFDDELSDSLDSEDELKSVVDEFESGLKSAVDASIEASKMVSDDTID